MDDLIKVKRIHEVSTQTPDKSILARIRGNKKFVYGVLILLLVVAVATTGYFLMKSDKTAIGVSDQMDVSKLLEQVSELTFLPLGEEPTVATVTDIGQLKDQAFFANAQVGDKVIIYTKAKKAILYRPSADKIVEIAPLNLDLPDTINPDKP